MTIATEAGYVWANGKNARMIHAGNKFALKTITPSLEAVTGNGQLVDNDLTRDRWIPHANELLSPTDLSSADWTASNATVDTGDGQTIDEGVAVTTTHYVEQSFTFTAGEWVFAIIVERATVGGIRLDLNDGTDTFSAEFDLRDKTAGTTTGTGVNSTAYDLGDNRVALVISATLLGAAGYARITLLSADASTDTYTGLNGTVLVEKATLHPSEATLRLDTFGSQGGTCFAIGAHNLGSAGARITFEHDSNEDDTWTSIGSVSPTDDSPIMFFFDTITSPRWRITVDRGALPEIGVVQIADPLVFERPFYSGFTPASMDRATEVIGNMSRTGELLGRSIKRTILMEEYRWNNLSYSWVRANLDGPNGVIQSVEDRAAFIAWRPSETDDASYLMRAEAGAPTAIGQRDLWSFSMTAEVYAYGK